MLWDGFTVHGCVLFLRRIISNRTVIASRASGRKRPATDSGRVLDNSNAPYDLSLPQNWNVKKLREELDKLGILYDIRVKKRRLIELYTAGTPNLSAGNSDVTSQTTRPRSESVTGEDRSSTARAQAPGVLVIQNESTTSARSAPAATSGESEISELHKNVSALQRTVSTLTETMDRFIKNATTPSSSMTTGVSGGDRLSILNFNNKNGRCFVGLGGRCSS